MTQRNRQLAAIVFTDIVGYASLMREDERQALELRKRHRAVFDTLTPKHGGRILQYYGDGTLSIFNSAVAAVECAVEMQREFRKDPHVPLRIGIHTGDISFDEVDVFGDGVNLASRVEPCCIPGGIFITGKVYDDIKNHEWLSARKLGDFTFKGIVEPILLYAIDNEGVKVPGKSDIHALRHSDTKLVQIKPASTFSDKIRQVALISIPILLAALLGLNLWDRRQPMDPVLVIPPEMERTSIAVLPFDNFSETEGNEYFSNGITEDILTMLSRVDGLKVVSRTSVMPYKNSQKSIREIGRELNADHILEGSIRRNGDKVRIVAQLIDAHNDDHIWAETYDQEITEIFDVQSKVAQDIAKALSKKLSEHEWAEICKKPTDNVRAYELYLQGRELYTRYTPKDNERAIELFGEALEEDPDFAHAYAGLGDALAQKAFKSGMSEQLLDSAIAMSTNAIRLDRELSEGYKALGLAYHLRGWYEKALEEYRKAVERNPNNDMAINNIGAIYQEQGNLIEAIRWGKRALSINPRHTHSILNLARMYYAVGNDEQCLKLIRGGLEQHPDFMPFQEMLAAVFLRQGNLAAAKEHALRMIAGTSNNEPMGYLLMGEISLMERNLEDAGAFFREVNYLIRKFDLEYPSEKVDIGLAFVEIKTGNAALGRTRLKALLRKVVANAEQFNMSGYDVMASMGFAILGEPDKALRWLERAIEHNWYDYQTAQKHPFFENLHDHPRFRQLMMGLKTRVEGLRRETEALLVNGLMT
jgi:adenylate cyclase